MADRYGLEVADRRIRDQLIDAVAGSRKVVLGEALTDLSRDRLMELCRELGLDDSGREKSLLVVVAHELAHVVRNDDTHSPAYWALLGRVMPDYDSRRDRLRTLGPSLEW